MNDNKKTKIQLIEELERYRKLFDNAPLGYHSMDNSGNLIDVNETWCRTLGYSRDEVVGRNITKFLHPDFREHFKENFPKFKSKGYIFGVEYIMIKKDGSEINVSFDGKIGYDEDGTFKQTHCVLKDITERKLAKEALQNSEVRLKALSEASFESIFISDSGVCLDQNKTAEKIFGYTRAEAIGMYGIEWIIPEDRNYVKNNMLFNSEEPYEVTALRKDGTTFPAEIQAKSMNYKGRSVRVTALRDITDRKQIEEKFKEEHKNAQMYFDFAGMMFIALDKEGTITLVNRKACKVLGYTEQEIVGKNWFDTCLPQSLRETVKEISRQLMQDKIESVEYYENVIVTKSGSERLIAWQNTILRDKKGSIIGSLSSGEDITDHKQAEKKLRESEEKYRTLISSMSDIIFMFDEEDRYVDVYCQPNSPLIFPREEILGKRLQDLMPQGVSRSYSEVAEKLRRNGQTQRFEYPLRIEGKDMFFMATLDLHKDGKSIVAGIRNITIRKQAEKALQESEMNLRTFFNTINDFMFILDEQGNILECNQTAIQRLGYSRKELRNKDVQFLHPENRRDEAGQIILEISQGKQNYYSVPLITRKDELIPVETYVSKGIWNGKPALFSVSKDISALKLSEEKFSKAFHSNPAIAGMSDLETGEYIEVNQAFYDILGYTPDEVIGKKVTEVVHIDRDFREKTLNKLKKQGYIRNEETIITAKNGTPIDVLLSAEIMEFSGRKCNYTTAIDITDRKQAEEALRASEERFRTIFETAEDSIFIKDCNLRYVQANPAMEKIFGMSASEIIGKTDVELFGEEAGLHIMEVDTRVMNGEILRVEHTKPINDASVTFNVIKVPMLDASGKIIGLCGIARDITESKKAEKTLRESEEKVSAAFNQTFQFMGLLELDGTLIKINQKALEFAGVEEKEVLGKPFWETIWWTHSTELQDKLHDAIKKALNGQLMRFEVTHTAHDETLHNIDFSLKPVRDESGKIIYLSAEGHDITEHKKAKINLQESESQYKNLYSMMRLMCDNLPDFIWTKDAEGRFLFVNKACSEKLLDARDTDEPIGNTDIYFADRMMKSHPEIPDYLSFGKKCIASDITVLETKKPTRFDESGNIKGKFLSLDVYKAPFNDDKGEIIGTVGCARIVTKERQMEKELRENEEKYRLLADNSIDAIWQMDLKLVFTYISPSVKDIMGYTVDEWVGSKLSQHVSGKEFFKIARKILYVIKHYKEFKNATFNAVMLCKDGTEISVEITGKLLLDKNGLPVGLQGTTSDITKRKKAEEANARLSRAIEQADETIVITDAEGTIQYVNPAFEKVTGYTAKEAIGQNPRILKSGQHDDAFYENMWATLSSGKEWRGEIINKKKDGTLFTENATISPVYDSQGKIVNYVAAKNDITETKRLQALEFRAERLETAGTIAGQVAHDFNNLLGPIMAYPEFVHKVLPHDHKAHTYLDAIENAAKKIADINQDLLTMGRRGHFNQEVFDLNRIVLQATQEIEDNAKTIEVKTDLCEDLMKIKGGAAQIHRMLTNLLVNAQDAMNDIGRIIIKTENYYADDTSVLFGRVPKGEYIKLTVSDNGCGIPEEIVQKIFDPFFTSKIADKRRGSGLGMSVVDSVIRDHNGYIDLSTKIGVGTSFYIYFPITRESMDCQDSEEICGGDETILVVDDDDIQREVSSQLLTDLGYKVSAVDSGEKAVEFLKENQPNIMILDMIMPGGIDGTETYRRVLEIVPNQKAIVISGYSETDRIIKVQKLGAGAFVRKPVTKSIIAAAVRKELNLPQKELAT